MIEDKHEKKNHEKEKAENEEDIIEGKKET